MSIGSFALVLKLHFFARRCKASGNGDGGGGGGATPGTTLTMTATRVYFVGVLSIHRPIIILKIPAHAMYMCVFSALNFINRLGTYGTIQSANEQYKKDA